MNHPTSPSQVKKYQYNLMSKRIHLTVTTDLNYDQRMQRICTSLAEVGYDVTLVGRKKKNSPKLLEKPYKQKRLSMFFQKGFMLYVEYNLRLFLYLLSVKTDAICSIDLDSILAGYIASRIKKTKRVYDAHELFCEMEEIIARPRVYKIWKWIEQKTLTLYPHGYTIGGCYAEEYRKMYGHQYHIVRNATRLSTIPLPENTGAYILYQGSVNEGRCFEQLIPAMQHVDYKLVICGEGNFMQQTKDLIEMYGLADKVELKGYVPPDELVHYTQNALCGITLFTSTCLSNYYSLGNRFFDYIHQGIPQLAVALPEYIKINDEFEVATLLPPDDVSPTSIAEALNRFIQDTNYQQKLASNTQACKQKYNWQNEEKSLLRTWEEVFED